ncbi:MAG: T9SS type A sorting domain-containing protein, partial [Methylococcaceae bacterium]
ITGITNLEGSQKLEVYPNPANSQLFYNTAGMTGNYKVKIINFQGVIVMQYSTNNLNGDLQQIDISSLAEGAYLFSLENQSEKHYCRFIKSK